MIGQDTEQHLSLFCMYISFFKLMNIVGTKSDVYTCQIWSNAKSKISQYGIFLPVSLDEKSLGEAADQQYTTFGCLDICYW